jgi:amino acid adenylation domain-containing protein
VSCSPQEPAALQSAPSSTFVDLLRLRAERQPDQLAYRFLPQGEHNAHSLTYAALDRQAHAIGAALVEAGARDQRVLLLYPPGLDYIAAFFGCLYAGAVAVPAYPPTSTRLDRGLAQRLRAIVRDARPTLALLPAALLPLGDQLAAHEPDFAALRWLATDQLIAAPAAAAQDGPAVSADTLALLQYTSGSTATPKGVMLTHGNLLHNSALIHQAFGHSPASRGVIWLPPYHDMGLIGGILQPLYGAFPVTLMSPVSFLQRPLRWLEAISEYGGTTSGGPNFAYELCVRKTTPEQRAALDLSSWTVAFTGAEPIRPATLARFAAAFAPAGFRPEAFYPCYGLAEATLIVAGGRLAEPPLVASFDADALTQHRVAPAAPEDADSRALVGCGPALGQQQALIVDPERLTTCPPGVVGEIWVRGPSVAQGYWDRAEQSAATFGAQLADAGPFLRTGDLGFLHDGQLFIAGRLKDLIIIRGRNHYPQDIELTAETSHAALRPGAGAAFTVEIDGEERLVIAQEVERQHRHGDLEAMTRAIRQAVAETHELQVYAVALLKPGDLPKTSSGKIQRHAARAAFLAGALAALSSDTLRSEPDVTLPGERAALSRTELLAAAPHERPPLLAAYLQGLAAHALEIPPSQLGPDQPLSALGLDSLMAVELQHAVEVDLGLIVPMVSFLQGLSIAAIAAQTLDQLAAADQPPAPTALADSTAEAPLSFAQERLWLLDQLDPDHATYTIPGAVRLQGALDLDALERSLGEIVRRHATLRATFSALDGQAVQRIAPPAAANVELHTIDLGALPPAEREAELLRLVGLEIAAPFDLEHGPLVRITLLRLHNDEHVLLAIMHHIIADGWSMAIFVRELAALYAAFRQDAPAPLAPLPIQYADFAAWQRAWLQGRRMDEQRDYWRRQLARATALDLPTDRPRSADRAASGAPGARALLRLPSSLAAALQALSRQEGATLFMTLLAAFKLLLARHSGQDDILVGAPIAGRTRASAEGLIGCFLNTLVLRTSLAEQPSFRGLLQRVRQVCLDAYAHQDLPFEQLLEELQPERSAGRTPLFQVFFNMLNIPEPRFELPGLQIAPFALPEVNAKFDLTLYVRERDAEIELDLVYNADLFAAPRMSELLGQLQRILEQVAATPDQPIAQVSLLTTAARALLPDPQAALSRSWSESVQARFAAQAWRAPDRTAVVDSRGAWSYAELDAWSNRIANALLIQGAPRQAPVAIYAHRSAPLVAALLGVLKAGAAFMILDPAYPPARLLAQIEIARPHALLAIAPAGALPDALADWLATAGCSILALHTPGSIADDPLLAYPPFDPQTAVAPDDLAYITFTSGSTGQPKAIMGAHRSLAHFFQWHAATFALDQTDRFSMLAGLAHDPLLRDVFTPLWLGATLCIPDPEQIGAPGWLPRWLREQAISVMHLTPALGQLLDEATGREPLTALRYAFFGADVLTGRDIERLRALAPATTCVNFYGASETPQAVGYHIVSPTSAADERAPLGRGIADVQLLILTSEQRQAGIGELGELYVRTPYLALGYLGQERLSEERFVRSPRAADPADRMYRTGDLGRYTPDGLVTFAGRADQQIKIRGYRVEPDEIAAALLEHPAVREAAVIAQGTGPDTQLVAYMVGEEPRTGARWANQEPTENREHTTRNKGANEQGSKTSDRDSSALAQGAPLQPSALRSFLAQRLPSYMIPAAFVAVDGLPRTPNGKIDRRALAERMPTGPAEELRGADGFAPPRSDREAAVAAIWADVLGLAQIGIHDNFFALGGHSLLATRLIARLQQTLAIELPLRTLFAAPTVASLTALIAERSGERPASEALPALTPAPEQRHAPFPLTDIQQAYWIGRRGVFELGDVATHSYIEIEARRLDLQRFGASWRRLIERHEMLRAIVLPDGRQQILADVPAYEIAALDLRDLPPEQAAAQLEAVRARMSHQVLPSDQWPLFEIRATLLDQRRTRLHISTDALISDAWSRRMLAREFVELYAQPDAALPPLDVSFRDYVLAEERLRETERYQRALRYWRERLPQLPPAPELPLIAAPNTLDQARFVRRSAQLEPAVWRQLKTRATGAGLTPSAVLLAAFAETLSAWSKHPHFTLNLTLFNRLPLHPQIDQIIGDFTSSTLLAVDASGSDPFVERARRLQTQLWDDLDQRYVSGVQVLRELARAQGSGLKAAMPVVFTSTLTQRPAQRDEADLTQLGEIVYSISQTPQVWLDHQVFEQRGALVFNWDAVEALFPTGLLQDMFAAYCDLLQRLAEDGASWQAASLVPLPPAQQARRAAVNATDAPVPDGLLHSLFAAQAAQRPEQIAVIAPDARLSYATLQRQATALAHRLRGLGARPNTLVAVVMEKGWQQVVAVLGILEAGAAYLPIDPALPAERLRYVIEHGQATIAVTQPWLDERLLWPSQLRRVLVEPGDADDAPLAPLAPTQQPHDLAYVIYTSGSTGQPKGVMIDHRGALNTIVDINQRFDVGPGDRALALSSLSFDLSVYDIFGMLAAGGAIVMPPANAQRDPAQWAALIERERVTLWNSVPALLEMLVEHAAGRAPLAAQSFAAPLRVVMLSGDWIPLHLPERIAALAPAAAVFSLGGATEASIWSILYPIQAVDPDWKSVPYGRPMRNQQFYVLDERLEPRPDWTPGELYIGGIGLAQGYWRDPDKTAARFITHPRTGARLYRTGDLGRYLPDGAIEFLGREDFQVKIQGYRVELGEIEAALGQHPAVRAAVVAAVGERTSRRLVAYVVAEEPRTENREQRSEGTREQGIERTKNGRPLGTPRTGEPGSQGVADPRSPIPDPRSLAADLRSPISDPRPPTADHRSPITRMLDPAERLRFKLSQPGLRQLDERPYVELSRAADEAALEAEYLRRRSYRAFADGPISLDDLSVWLGCLRQLTIEGAALPKYRYGSAGSLYPVQAYLHVKADRVDGLAAGAYYYDPRAHRLVALSAGTQLDRRAHAPANRALFDAAAFSLFLIAQMDAIRPVYGDESLRFALLEAGAITQLLEQSAPTHRIGLCQVGALDAAHIRDLFALDERHVFLHSLSGGPIAIEQTQRPAFLRDSQAYEALTEEPRTKSQEPGERREQGTENREQRTENNGTHEQGNKAGQEQASEGLITDTLSALAQGAPLQPAALRQFLAQRLPEYMVPATFVLLDALPLTANGKIDRKALLEAVALEPEPDAAFVAPQSELERSLATLVQETLGIERVGVHDNFFDLGGNSIHLVQVHSRLQRLLGRELPLVELFTHPTIGALSKHLSQSQPEPPASDPAQEQKLKAGKDRLLQLRKRSAT